MKLWMPTSPRVACVFLCACVYYIALRWVRACVRRASDLLLSPEPATERAGSACVRACKCTHTHIWFVMMGARFLIIIIIMRAATGAVAAAVVVVVFL